MALSKEAVMKQPDENKLKKILTSSVKQALQKHKVDGDHCLLIRFYSDLDTVNSKAYQAHVKIGQRPSRQAMVEKAARHMYLGDTKNSYFISFSEDIDALLNAISGFEVSAGVKSIIQGSNPQFFGKKGMEKISWAPAKFVGIFKVNKANIVKWNDGDLKKAVKSLLNKEKQHVDLKKNFEHEHEVVAYYPGKLEAPLEIVDNPFYSAYMDSVQKH